MKTFIAIALIFGLACPVLAGDVDSPFDVELTISNVSRAQWTTIPWQKKYEVRWMWKDASGNVLRVPANGDCPATQPNGWNVWECKDIEVPGTNAGCVAEGDPFPCCTGEGTGTCDDMLSTCFTDVYNFTIRTQEVGKDVGPGLQLLLKNKWKAVCLPAGNNTDFE